MSVGAVRASGSPSAFESRPNWQVPHLFDLLTGLIDWNPHERLGTTGGASQLMQHEYWGETDWELAGIRRLASPLRTEASRRVAARQKRWAQEAEDTSSGAPAKMDAIVKKLTKGQLQGSDRTSRRGRISQLSSFDTKAWMRTRSMAGISCQSKRSHRNTLRRPRTSSRSCDLRRTASKHT